MSAMKFADPAEFFRKAVEPAIALQWLKMGGEVFWSNQDRALDSIEQLSRGWFERRHAGVRAAQEAVAGMCSARSPLDALHGYQQWANGAFDRMMADAVAVQQYASMGGAALLQGATLPREAPAAPHATAQTKADAAA